jgi:hypothetical protein
LIECQLSVLPKIKAFPFLSFIRFIPKLVIALENVKLEVVPPTQRIDAKWADLSKAFDIARLIKCLANLFNFSLGVPAAKKG